MASDPPQAAAQTLASPATRSLALAAVFLVSAVLCMLGYLALAAPGPWFGGARTLQWNPGEFAVTRGSALRTREGLVISAPDAMNTVVIAINTSFRSRDYALIAWDAAGVPDDVEATLLWSNDYAPSRMFRRTLTVEAGRIAPELVVQDRDWLGRINGLALVLQGSFTEPIVLPGATSIAEFGTANRATLPLAPLLTCLCVLLWRELTTPGAAPTPQPTQQGADLNTAVASDA